MLDIVQLELRFSNDKDVSSFKIKILPFLVTTIEASTIIFGKIGPEKRFVIGRQQDRLKIKEYLESIDPSE